MAEGAVTVDEPARAAQVFFVVATQNPQEEEGTFLPESQLDVS